MPAFRFASSAPALVCCFLASLAQAQSRPADTAQAQDAVALDAITVVGERTARSRRETASSVSVLTAEDLDATPGPDTVESLLTRIPNVQAGNAESGPTFRGQDTTGVLIGADAFLGGSRARTTIQVDGRPLSFNEYIYGLSSAWDIAQVEVYRTPQTTTQGRNSIAGAIFVETRDPTFEPEWGGRAIAGDYGTRQLSAYGSGPLGDDGLAFRIAADARDHETFVDLPNTTRAGIGIDPTRDDYRNLRAKLLYQPPGNPALSTKFTFTRTDRVGPQGEIVEAPFRDRRSLSDQFAFWRTQANTLANETEYAFSDAVSLKNTLTRTDLQIQRFSTPGSGVAQIDGDEWTNETLLSIAPGGAWRGTVGVYAIGTDNDERIDLTAFLGTGAFTDRNDSLGVFGEATWQATPKLDVTAGLRWQRDHQDRDGALSVFAVDYDRSFEALLPKLSVGYDLSERLRVGALVQRAYNPGGTTISFETGAQDTFDEEHLWNYELFARGSWLDGRLQANGNVFYTAFRDAQRGVTTLVDGRLSTAIDNAERARAYGLELEMDYRPRDGVRLFGGLGLLRTELQEYSISAVPVEGNAFQRAPKATLSLGGTFALTPRLTLDLRSRYVARQYSDDVNAPEFENDAYSVTDVQLSCRAGSARMFAYASNVFDAFYTAQAFAGGFAYPGDPREFGAGVEFAF